MMNYFGPRFSASVAKFRSGRLCRQLGGSILAFLLLAASACSKETNQPLPTPEPGETKHTLMVYLTGISLLRFYQENIQGMCNAVDQEMLRNNRILICYQPSDRLSAVVQEVRYNADTGKGTLETIRKYDQFEAADPSCVADVFAFMQTTAPADSYGVIIGCHGKAWVPASSGILHSPGKEAFEDYWKPAEGALPTRSFGDSGHELDIPELAAVLEGLDVRPDYLIFDACFMANIETLYDLRRSAAYIVASPCEVMGIGFPYEHITPALFSDDGTAQKMQQVCENFYAYFDSQQGYSRSGCVSMAISAKLDGLAEIMRLINAVPKQPEDTSSLQIYEALSSPLFFDLEDYVSTVCGDPALLTDFESQMEKAFPPASRFHTPSFYSAYNRTLNPIYYYSGVSISEPSEKYEAEYRATNWYRATH